MNLKLLPFLLVVSTSFAAVGDWEVMGTKDNVIVSKREVPGSDVLAFRGEGDVSAPLAKVATVIFDTKRAPEWIVDLAESKLIRWTNDMQFVEYDHVRTPIILKDRDFVSLVDMKVSKKPQKGLIFHYKSITDPELPLTNFVRGDLMNTTFILTSIENDTKTHVIGEIHADPKGNIPKWLVNFFQEDWPHDTLQNLRGQVQKPDVVELPKFRHLFD